MGFLRENLLRILRYVWERVWTFPYFSLTLKDIHPKFLNQKKL
jgi:hypothetical protein